MNFMLASAIEAMSEASVLAESYEIESAKLIELATGTLFAAPAYAAYGRLITEREFEPGFRLTLGLKDVRLALANEARGVPLPFASVVRDNPLDAIGHGDAEKDWSALALVARRRAGLGLLANFSHGSGDRFQKYTSWPAFISRATMPCPIEPRPMHPTFITSSARPIFVCLTLHESVGVTAGLLATRRNFSI